MTAMYRGMITCQQCTEEGLHDNKVQGNGIEDNDLSEDDKPPFNIYFFKTLAVNGIFGGHNLVFFLRNL